MFNKSRILILCILIKEPKNIDFYTTGKQPSDQEFIRISEWIKNQKNKLKRPTQKGKKKSTLSI
jgi:flagellar biosynthesis protein FliP